MISGHIFQVGEESTGLVDIYIVRISNLNDAFAAIQTKSIENKIVHLRNLNDELIKNWEHAFASIDDRKFPVGSVIKINHWMFG